MNRLSLLLVMGAVCAFGTAAPAAASDKGVLSMTPARRTLVARPPVHLAPTRVSNTTDLTMRVTVFPTLLTQSLDGSFGFNEDTRDLNAARLIFPVKPQRFVLKPNQERDVDLNWALMPRSAKAGYFGLVVQGVPIANGRGVGSVLRLLGINFFTLPGHWHAAGRLTGLRGEQAGPRELRFFPRVSNTGQIHAQPRGRCSIADSRGSVVVKRLSYGQGEVLPGFQREYPIVLRKPDVLPRGAYTMRCTQRFGAVRSSRTLRFSLSGPNTLPTAALRLGPVSAWGAIGGHASVSASVRNAGSKAAPAFLKLRIDRIPVGSAPVMVTRGRFPEGLLAAGRSKHVAETLGKDLVRGNYRATIVLSDGRTDLDERTVDFVAKPPPAAFSKFGGLWPWLLLLVAIGIVAWLLWRQRRRRRELERELALARLGAAVAAAGALEPEPMALGAATVVAGAPAAVVARAAAATVNINTASVEELTLLPRVGPRAAERIVAHREEYGSFASVADLAEVDGFDAERIGRLAGNATV